MPDKHSSFNHLLCWSNGMRKTIQSITPVTVMLLMTAAYAAPFSPSPKSNTPGATQGMTYPTPVTPNPTFSTDKFKAEVDTRSKQNKDALNKQFEKILPKTPSSAGGNQALPYDPTKDTNTSSAPTTTDKTASGSRRDQASPAPTTDNMDDSVRNNPFSNSNNQPTATTNQEPVYSGFGTKPQNQTGTGNSQSGSGSKSSGWNVQY
jgi:hypothetical protein